MKQSELTTLHLSAMSRWDMDSPDVDQALTDAGLNPADPSGYTEAQAVAACQSYARKIGSRPFPLFTVTRKPEIGVIKVKR